MVNVGNYTIPGWYGYAFKWVTQGHYVIDPEWFPAQDSPPIREVVSWQGRISQKQPTLDNPFWVVVLKIFYFHPYLGKVSILTNIFQRGWNHQLEQFF